MYNLTLGQSDHSTQKNQTKKHMSFMPHALNQSEHSFGQCEHFS
jgi:hypothetical protein